MPSSTPWRSNAAFASPHFPILTVRDLSVLVRAGDRDLPLVDRVSFDLAPGRTLALVGESGCGKTLTALALLQLVEPPGRISGSIRLHDSELVGAPARTMAALRGNRIAMIFQEARSALNPVLPVGEQIAEPLRLHKRLRRAEARKRTVELLNEVGIAAAAERYFAYPHELSGGMCQRVLIAMAIACEPEIVIADEPTSQLDVTVQVQIVELLRALQRAHKTALLFISHDLSLVEAVADEVAVMYAGRIVEQGSMEQVAGGPQHPYTRALWYASPALQQRGERLPTIPGMVPPLDALPSGCAFHERCPKRRDRCRRERPEIDRGAACFYPYNEPLERPGGGKR